jgi:hypothetical protein
MTDMGDGNERAMVDEQFQQHAVSNEGRILSLEQYVTGKGGIFNLMQELKQQLGDLSKNFDDKMSKFDDRMDGFDRELQEVKRIVNEEKNLRVDKEKLAAEAKKPAVAMGYSILEKLIWLILAGVIAWLGWLVVAAYN